jgi:triacylglycerol lipase
MRRQRDRAISGQAGLWIACFVAAHLVAGCGASDPCQNAPIVFVHGFGGNAKHFNRMIAALNREGWPESWLVALDLPRGVRIEEWGERIVAATGQLHDRTGCPVEVVGYSMGGLAARWAVMEGGAAASVGAVVTIGAPHKGTPIADQCDAPACAQMRSGSPFLRDLDLAEALPEPVWVAIASRVDQVVPIRSAKLPGALNITVCCPSHRELPLHPKVIDAVRESLR